MTKPCVVCRKSLEGYGDELGDELRNHPIDAIAFTSQGHYGTKYDPMDGTTFELNICDPCMDSIVRDKAVIAYRVKSQQTIYESIDLTPFVEDKNDAN